MPRPSKIDRLPPEIREEIGTLRDRGYTIDEILGHLRALDIPPEDRPSWSGLHRHIQGLDRLADRMQRSRAVAEALVRKLGDAPEDRTARLNIELMHSAILDLFMSSEVGEDGQPGAPITLDPESAMLLAKALKDLSSARNNDAALVLKLRTETEKKAKTAAVKAAEAVARERGLSADTINAIKAQILGVKVGA